jgi:transcriptional regulator with XRE-family HTH domain
MVARYETGVASPTVRTLRRLLRAAGRELELSARSPGITSPASPLALALREHRAEIKAAAERVGARNVRVFGSVARGEDTAESDVDLLVDFPVRERGLLPLLPSSSTASRT